MSWQLPKAMVGLASNFVTIRCMGGQGARRKRNWRHNQPNSPFNWARMQRLRESEAAQQQAKSEQQPGNAKSEQPAAGVAGDSTKGGAATS